MNTAEFYKPAVTLVSELAGTDYTTSFQILIALTIVVLTCLLLLILSCTSRSSGNFIALLGLSNCGKTRMLFALANGTEAAVDTVTSMKENVWHGLLHDAEQRKKFSIVDIPGAEKIRRQVFDLFKTRVKALVFVIDSNTFTKEAKDIAEYLYDVLSDPVVSKKKIPILVACNKHDMAFAKSTSVVKAQLQKELTLLNSTRASALESTDGSVQHFKRLGRGGNFEFSQLPQRIDFCECSAVLNEDNQTTTLKPVLDWLTAN